MAAPPAYSSTFQPQPPLPAYTEAAPQKSSIFSDNLFCQKLQVIENYEIRQANVLVEAATLGIWANTYVISDLDRPTSVLNYKDPNETMPTPVFLVKEESNCCVRCCCPGNQALTAKVYHASPQPVAGNTLCGCCYTGHQIVPDTQAGVAMTLERQGCCSKCLGCFVCGDLCVNEMFMHAGDKELKPGTTVRESTDYFARSTQPVGGGGFTPTLNLHRQGEEAPMAVMQGPCFFGGWKSACCDTIFKISSVSNKSGDVAIINKKKARDCKEWCMQLCTPTDIYEVKMNDAFKGMDIERRAAVLGNVIHLDYLLFENDAPPIQVRREGNSTVIICTLCEFFCYGCVCPIQVCFAASDN